jgi:pSer/pThr/pTyr-binding forkhead associated (FHA) protein
MKDLEKSWEERLKEAQSKGGDEDAAAEKEKAARAAGGP